MTDPPADPPHRGDASSPEGTPPERADAEPTGPPESDDPDLSFSIAGAREGFLTAVPVAVGVGGYGLVFGVIARRAGLSVATATLMSATVFAGAAQVVAVEVWADPIPILTVVATAVVVNLRYVLMGATLRPWFETLSPTQAYGSLFFSTDESWAVSMAALRGGGRDGAVLLGSGLAVWVFWVGATAVGAGLGGAVADPARWGLDFVLTGVFLVLATSLWRGRSTLAPWIAAAAVAVVAARLLPGEWYVLLGGLAASVAAVIRGE